MPTLLRAGTGQNREHGGGFWWREGVPAGRVLGQGLVVGRREGFGDGVRSRDAEMAAMPYCTSSARCRRPRPRGQSGQSPRRRTPSTGPCLVGGTTIPMIPKAPTHGRARMVPRLSHVCKKWWETPCTVAYSRSPKVGNPIASVLKSNV